MADSKICSSCGSDLTKCLLYIRNSERANLFNYIVLIEGDKKDIISKFMASGVTAPQYPFSPYKCANCGHVEFYADDAEPWRY